MDFGWVLRNKECDRKCAKIVKNQYNELYWWCLAERLGLSGDSYNSRDCYDAWRLTICVPRQAIWKRVSSGGSGAALGDNAVAATLIVLMCVVYKALVISLRSACWHSSSVARNGIPQVELGMADEHEEPLSWDRVGECSCMCSTSGGL